jgi:hypothetical protein
MREACGKRDGLDKVKEVEGCELIGKVLQIMDQPEKKADLCVMYGIEFKDQYANNEELKIDELIQWVRTENTGLRVIDVLEETFKEVSVNEHYGNFFKFQVSRDDKSIGQLFGLMEDVKQQVAISEYQVS